MSGVGFKPFWPRLLDPNCWMEFFDSSFYWKLGYSQMSFEPVIISLSSISGSKVMA